MTEYTKQIDTAIESMVSSYGVSRVVLMELIEMAIELGEQNVIDNPFDYFDLTEFAPEKD